MCDNISVCRRSHFICVCMCAEIYTDPSIMPPNMATSKGAGRKERRAEPLGADCNNDEEELLSKLLQRNK